MVIENMRNPAEEVTKVKTTLSISQVEIVQRWLKGDEVCFQHTKRCGHYHHRAVKLEFIEFSIHCLLLTLNIQILVFERIVRSSRMCPDCDAISSVDDIGDDGVEQQRISGQITRQILVTGV